MLLLLPPSETKRDGGVGGSALDLAALSFVQLTPQRVQAMRALRTLSRNLAVATGALGLGPTQRFEIDRNRTLTTSPVMAAIERYTGVLFDGLDAGSLTTTQRRFAHEHVVLHSALFGLLRADDQIPAYRLSHNSRLPNMPLRRLWREPCAAVLAAQGGLVLDLRSEAYAALGPAPAGSWYVRVVSESPGGRKVALSHFNKKAKGEFTRAIVGTGIVHDSVESLLPWAARVGIRLEWGAPGELDLVV